MGELDVHQEMVIKGGVGELEDGLWNIMAGSLDWNIVVLLEVDTGLLLAWVIGDTEELALETGVWWSSSVLAILPCSVTRSTVGDLSTTTATTTRSWATIAVAVEGRWSMSFPSTTASSAVWSI
jgi:hypothetical protein